MGEKIGAVHRVVTIPGSLVEDEDCDFSLKEAI